MPLFSYVKTAMRQAVTHIWELWWFESIYTLQGKPNIHDMYASRANPRTPLIRFLRTVPVRGNLSRWLNRVEQIYCSQEKVLLTPPLSPAKWPMGPASVSLPNITFEVVCLNQIFIDKHATSVYWTHITSMWSVRSILARGGQPIGP
jgi:hypothetical protein